jgi:hypothetical protein
MDKELLKRQISDDIFTTPDDAVFRSSELGFGGDIHVYQTADGERTYMPAVTHDEYLGKMPENTGTILDEVIRSILNAVMSMNYSSNEAKIIKADSEEQIAWGWASVVSEKGEAVTDRQGDIISPDEMEKMATKFMLSARQAKAMHDGEGIGEVVHSFPMTKQLAKEFGLTTDREGWIIAMKISDTDIWNRVKSGQLKAFSIGGTGRSEPINE